VGVRHVFVGLKNVDEEVTTKALVVAKNSPYLLSLHIECFEGITAYLVQVGQRCRNLVELTLRRPFKVHDFDMYTQSQ
jgi:hypothetical protein